MSSVPTELQQDKRIEFEQLQLQLAEQFKVHFPDPLAPKTVVVIPSLSLDPEILSKISGHIHYEERMLCLLLLLRMPRTHMIYVSSMPIDEVIVDYYLHLIPGVTSMHARQRLTLLSCHDSTNIPLASKVLSKPRLLQKIKDLIPIGHEAHLSAFNVTPLEEELALRLNIPLYGCPSNLAYLGSKTGARKLFEQAGLDIPPGYENINSIEGVLNALRDLRNHHGWVRRAVIKLNEGFSGDGNAVYTFEQNQDITDEHLKQNLKIVAGDLTYDLFMEKMSAMGGIVEAFIEGDIKRSPSVQVLINPLKKIEIVSTHDQILGGESGQVYLGASFPADLEYRKEIGELGYKLADKMASMGVLGRFGVDFVSIKLDTGWKHFAIEINLRKGGTTHPYLMLQLLTNGHYDYKLGEYLMPNGQTRYYVATDAMIIQNLKKLTPADLIDVVICNNLHFDGTTQEGIMFHLIGAVSQHGKLGILSIAKSLERAQELYDKTTHVLNLATA